MIERIQRVWFCIPVTAGSNYAHTHVFGSISKYHDWENTNALKVISVKQLWLSCLIGSEFVNQNVSIRLVVISLKNET